MNPLPQTAWRKFLLQIDDDLKDPLTVLQFTLQELHDSDNATKALHQKLKLSLAQIERMKTVLQKVIAVVEEHGNS